MPSLGRIISGFEGFRDRTLRKFRDAARSKQDPEFLVEYRAAGLKMAVAAAFVAGTVVVVFIVVDSLSQVSSRWADWLRLVMLCVLALFVFLASFYRDFVLRNYVPICTSALVVILGILALIIGAPGAISLHDGFSAAPVLLFVLLLHYGFVRLPVLILLAIGFLFTCAVVESEGSVAVGAGFYRMILYAFLANVMGCVLAYSILRRESALFRERKALIQARDALFVKNGQLRAAHEENNLILAAVGHDIRPPLLAAEVQLRVISGIAAEAEGSELSALVRGTLDALGFVRLAIEDLLYSRRFERVAPESLKEVDISDLIRRAVDVCQPLAKEKGVSVRARLPSGGAVGFTDESLMGRIIQNLVINAIKFTHATGRADRAVLVAVRRHGELIRVLVLDQGVGIAESEIGSIWKPFYKSLRTSGGGSGLGLYVVQKAVGLLPRHSVSVSSQLNKGTCFRVELPLTSANCNVGFARDADLGGELEGAYVVIVGVAESEARDMAAWAEGRGALVDVFDDMEEIYGLKDSLERSVDAAFLCVAAADTEEVRVAWQRLRAFLPPDTSIALAVSGQTAIPGSISSLGSVWPQMPVSDRDRLGDFIRAGLARNIERERSDRSQG